ncbi:MAG: peptidylprolyl isomerase [Planctomycetes bacterium]|jgi:parvulin-like peptidyl-prolyl isomerase|nr:peptidylprolyl isomerase [Planctomycetota bacterium]
MAIIVNGERIEDQEIQQEVQRLRPSYEQAFAAKDPAAREVQLLDWSKENVVERVLLRQAAKQDGAAVPAADIEAAFARLQQQYEKPEDLYREFNAVTDDSIKAMIEVQMKVEQKIQGLYAAVPEPAEGEIRAYYEENREQFTTGEQIRIAHLVKYVNWQTDEPTALEAVTQAHREILAGAAFEAVVSKYTDCADNGGDLGYVVRGQLVEEFEDVAFNLSPGQVSDVFRTRFGFHIVKLYDRRPPSVAPLPGVRGQIVDEVREQKREQALGDYLDGLRSKAKIEEV